MSRSTAALEAPTLTQLGRYEVQSRLGEGAMGTVYRARDPLLDRLVALKTVNLNLPQDDLAEYEARFHQEARAAGGLSHPNIVVIYDIGRTDRVVYMAMEYLEGRELRSILSERGVLPRDEALDITAQLANALSYAHARGVVHRDIKPTNIMITTDGVPKITDFGIARIQASELKTMTGMILGSPRYMSPEQISGQRVDHRSDLFSLGVVLYELLTGRPPFESDSVHGIMYATLNAAAPPPSRIDPSIPRVLDFVLAKALAKKPEQRYQNARELETDLRAAIGAADAAPRPGTNPRNAAPTATATGSASTATVTKELTAPPIPSHPAFGLSRAFDSTEATLRLHALSVPTADEDSAESPVATSDFAPRRRSVVAPWLWTVSAMAIGLTLYLLIVQ